MAAEEKTKWVLCAACGHRNRNHRVLYEKKVNIYEDEPPPTVVLVEHHRLLQCMGCNSIKYAISKSDWEGDNVSPWNEETDLKVYPDGPGPTQQRLPAINQDEATDDDGKLLIPTPVWKMYKETLDALNANIRTLAGGGLRATVEAICLDNQIKDGGLQSKIDELAKAKFAHNSAGRTFT